MKSFEELKNKHKGEDIWLVLAGSSMDYVSSDFFKNKKVVQVLKFTWEDNPHGSRWDEIQDLRHSLMNSYQDYDSLIESEVTFKDDWDERIKKTEYFISDKRKIK